jgi:hypothetical protein
MITLGFVFNSLVGEDLQPRGCGVQPSLWRQFDLVPLIGIKA